MDELDPFRVGGVVCPEQCSVAAGCKGKCGIIDVHWPVLDEPVAIIKYFVHRICR